jgi:hypothetical protein
VFILERQWLTGEEELIKKVEESLAPGLLEGLIGKPGTIENDDLEPQDNPIVFKGTLDQIQDYFYSKMWTDGLPIIPPYTTRIDNFLKLIRIDLLMK